ncbi:MAG: substrate-binding domain-containing protein [Bacteroidales bacterium]|nr:substrate-binding domain-containing protein [Bacteroidales bacterium]MCM1415931.1 substrate-binding domain-containing protein [bacterium]MCM1422649.1 substrate-binding domain-containing protein [bacterium]
MIRTTNKNDRQRHTGSETPERKFSGFLPVFLTAVSVIMTVVLAVFVIWFYRGSYEEENAGGVYDRYYMLITQDSKSAFWQSVYQGANERALRDNVYVDWLGNDQFQNYSVEEQMQVAIASGVDGIIVTAGEDEEMTALIDQAAAEGIPVVTLYGDSTQSARCSFVSVGGYNLGREYGRQAVKIVREKLAGTSEMRVSPGAEVTTVKVGSAERPIRVTILVNSYANSLDQNIIYSGIQETIEQERGDTVIDLALQTVDDTNAFSVEESVRDLFMEGNIPDIMICLNELNTTCAYQAVVDYNKVGTVSILGYYVSDTILNAIDRDVIYSTVYIDAPQMGSFCIDALQDYHDLGNTSQYFTADISLISKENVADYLEEGGLADEE